MSVDLVAVPMPMGTVVIREGEPGDRYYAVADGELEVSRSDALQTTLLRGAGFGEIALIRDVPRQATVIARSDSLLYSLEKDMFVETVTGSASASRAAVKLIDQHLTQPGRSISDADADADADARRDGEGPVG